MMIYRFLFLFLLAAAVAAAADPGWLLDTGENGRRPVPAGEDGMVSAAFRLPGSIQLYREERRETFRPDRTAFDAGELRMELLLRSGPGAVRGTLFVKDKDGYWFRSEQEFEFTPGVPVTCAVRLDEPGRHWLPVGHAAAWSADYAVGIFAAGVSLYGGTPGEYVLECRNLSREGQRRHAPLAVRDWKLPAEGAKFVQMESRFRLTREYFNPFDPDEIEVDFEYRRKGDPEIRRYPAFYTRDFRRELRHVTEIVEPVGEPYWAFRFTPAAPGEYELRLVVRDKTPDRTAELVTPWRPVRIHDSREKGFVEVSRRNPSYFQFSNGEFFYPVGLNIHTNIDLRSEYRFRFGHLPDRGTYDYDEYFERCGENGITAVEVWMASWTCAIEWDSARQFYHGLGRYNLANAWRLDHLLRQAGRYGIRLNLVLDNHGKTSMDSDQEWNDNPFNSQGVFAAANGGFLEDAGTFFTDPRVKKYNSQRNRYIAARWGADPRIMAVELWSEVDLVSGFRDRYADGSAARWHAETAAEYRRWSQANHPITTHVCSDWRRNLMYRDIFEIPEHTHWAGDAYRSMSVHIVDQMRLQEANMRFPKPVLITEYGGASLGGDNGKILADVHGGLWSSFFKRQAGTPFLWWHDFVHIFNHYQHYRGFSEFIRGLDLRPAGMQPMEPACLRWHPFLPLHPPIPGIPAEAPDIPSQFRFGGRFAPQLLPPMPETRYEALAVGDRSHVYGWTFCRQPIFIYPETPEEYPEAPRLALYLDTPLEPGDYQLRFFDPLTGTERIRLPLRHKGGPMWLPLPPFRLDVAFKLEKTES